MPDQLAAGKLSTLKAIHIFLFGESYDSAGQFRTVNISKGNFRFAPLMYLEAAIENIDKMPQATFDEIVDWSKIDKKDHLFAMERSPINDIEIKYILKAALTDETDSREVYRKGIGHSYCCEGHTTFKKEDL